MELAGQEPAMLWQLYSFHQSFVSGRITADNQPRLFQPGNIMVVDLIAVAMALYNFFLAINGSRQ